MKKFKKIFLAYVFYIPTSIAGLLFVASLQFIYDAGIEQDISMLINSTIFAIANIAALTILAILAFRFKVSFIEDNLVLTKFNRMFYLLNLKHKKPIVDSKNELSFFTTDVDILNDSYYNAKIRISYAVIDIVLGSAMLLWLHWFVGIILITLTFIPFLTAKFFAKGMVKRQNKYSDDVSGYVGVVKEILDGKRDINSYSKQNIFLNKHQKYNKKVEKSRFNNLVFQSYSRFANQLAYFITLLSVTAFSVYFVIQGELTIGQVVVIVGLLNNVSNPILAIGEQINNLNSCKDILKKSREKNETEMLKKSINCFISNIEINNLGLSYDDENYIIKDFNIRFEKGKKYAILAPSGYGKSSIAKAISLEFTEFDGSIKIDGKDIRNIDVESYNNILRFVRQDPYLFNGTILENISFFGEPPEKERLKNILKITHIDEFLSDEGDLNRYVSNNSGLSGGQKQRIILARALVHNPKILILDEITSGIDLSASIKILEKIFENKELTVIAITHESDGNFLKLFDDVVNLSDVAV